MRLHTAVDAYDLAENPYLLLEERFHIVVFRLETPALLLSVFAR